MEYKCLIVGDWAVGKSTFTKRHQTGEFIQQHYHTDFLSVTTLPFQTTQGRIKFHVYDGGYDSRPDCAIIMFDLTNEKSWKHVSIYSQWLKVTFGDIPVVICGNKSDLQNRVVMAEHIERFHRQPNVLFFEVSTRTNYNYDKPFLFLWRMLNLPDQPYLELCNSELQFISIPI